MTIFIEKSVNIRYGVSNHIFKFLFNLADFLLNLFDIFLFLVDIITGNSPDTDFKKTLNILFADIPNQPIPERQKCFFDGRENKFICSTLFNLLIESLFDKNLFQEVGMKFLPQPVALNGQFCFKIPNQFTGIALKYF